MCSVVLLATAEFNSANLELKLCAVSNVTFGILVYDNDNIKSCFEKALLYFGWSAFPKLYTQKQTCTHTKTTLRHTHKITHEILISSTRSTKLF